MANKTEGRAGDSRFAKKKKIFTRKMQAKFLLVFCAVLVLFLILTARVVYLKMRHGVDYTNAVLSHQSYVNTNIPYERGRITDRNGAVLAKNVVTYNVILDPSVVNANRGMYVDPTVEAITKAFSLTASDVKEILANNPKSAYIVLLKDRSYEEVRKFKELQEENHKLVKGVWFETVFTRVYPYGSLASHVVGFVNSDQSMGTGVEFQYNKYLVGKPGRESGYYDEELNLIKKTWPAQDGDTIYTTLDVAVQSAVEKHIKQFNEETGCDNIGVIIMNPNNGEIYAMASNEGYDLNKPFDLSGYLTAEELAEVSGDETARSAKLNAMWKNFCIGYTFEPGSTYKCITVASALEEAVANPETSSYYCGGVAEMDEYKIHCNAKHGTVNLEQSLMRSCNMAMIDIAQKEGRTTFRAYQDRFGFGYKTGIDLPGEEKGILNDASKLNEVELATSSFGQGFNVTMVQMAAAYSSIVNGGYYYTPHVVKKIVNANGATVYEAKNTISARTVSKYTTDFMRKATYQTVESGTATPAKVKGYLVGGKTGTAQKGIRAEKKYIVSFIGSVPADNPQVVIYVVIDEVHSETLFNSSKPATMLTSAILQEILPHLGLYPSEGEIEYGVPGEENTDEIGVQNDDVKKDGEEKN